MKNNKKYTVEDQQYLKKNLKNLVSEKVLVDVKGKNNLKNLNLRMSLLYSFDTDLGFIVEKNPFNKDFFDFKESKFYNQNKLLFNSFFDEFDNNDIGNTIFSNVNVEEKLSFDNFDIKILDHFSVIDYDRINYFSLTLVSDTNVRSFLSFSKTNNKIYLSIDNFKMLELDNLINFNINSAFDINNLDFYYCDEKFKIIDVSVETISDLNRFYERCEMEEMNF